MTQLTNNPAWQSQLKDAIDRHRESLITLFESYDLATLGEMVQKSMFDDIRTCVLAEYPFYANHPALKHEMGTQGLPAFGDRILEPKDVFLMSEQDIERFYALCKPIYIERKLIRQDDTYVVSWNRLRNKAFNDINDLIIDEVLPEDIRPVFDQNRYNITFMRRLHDIIRGALGICHPAT